MKYVIIGLFFCISIFAEEKNKDIQVYDNYLNKHTHFSINDSKKLNKYREYLSKKKEIRVCVSPDIMPYNGVTKNNKLIGFTSDYLKEFSQKLKIPFKPVIAKNWSSILALAKKKECDIISAIETPSRKRFLTFTKAYMKTPIVIATNLKAPFIDNFKNLKKQKIGYPKDYAYVEKLKKKYPNINLIEVPSLRNGLQMVKDGELYGQIGTLASIGYFFQKEFTGELKITGKTDEVKLELAIGVRDDEPILRDILQEQINILDEAFHNKVLNHWISIQYEQSINYKVIIKILLVITIVLGFVFYNYFLLKRINRYLSQEVKKQVEINRKKDRLLFHQSKFALMGQMVNNIAHQWRQPLNAINSTVMAIDFELINKGLKTEALEKNLTDIELQTEFMSETIENFRDYFESNKKRDVFLLSEAVSSSLSLLKSGFIKKNIFINFCIIKDKKVGSYKGELIQVLISILNNAEDVLTNKREDELKSICIKVDNNIEIIDNGGGINRDIIDNIFEPYFTTKHYSKGTGIGLYLSKMIVEESLLGKISVENIENGAKFKIEI